MRAPAVDEAQRASGSEGAPLGWHALPIDELWRRLDSGPQGLEAPEAARRLAIHGVNELPRRAPVSFWQILCRQVLNPIIYILGIAAGISLAAGDVSDAGLVAAVVAVNTLIGGIQEYRADRSAHALRQLLQIRAVVLRGGEPVEIDARELVPGDVVLLEAGNRVPADVRLIWTRGLEVDQSPLTGESLPVVKRADVPVPPEAGLIEQPNMAFAGCIVARGRGRGAVVATGRATQVGRLALDVLETPAGKPPLAIRLERFTHRLGAALLVAAAWVGLAGVVLHGLPVSDMFMFAVALAVSAVPEGLPVAITVALAVGAHRMARRGVIVRRLHAVEGLGSCTLIASDKTGTLTCNELTVRQVHLSNGVVLSVTGEGFAPHGELWAGAQRVVREQMPELDRLLRAAVLCNEAALRRADGRWTWHGDPTDVALLTLARKAGWEPETLREQWPLLDQVPFEPEQRFAASLHRTAEQALIVAKGAPERLLDMCALSMQRRRALEQEAEQLAQRGHRVLALADRPLRVDAPLALPAEPRDLHFLGLLGMIDPLRPGAREAVAACRQAGITVCMVTGDHPVTALAIARELGLARHPRQVVCGEALERQSPGELERTVCVARVFARVTPRHKLAIVQAARRVGHFVAVTGDGANDAPALRAAHVGVAMGRSGTDVARESSDLVISDDHFATIVTGVQEGRIAYDNIRKVILLLTSTGAAEVLLVALAVLAGTPLPLLPVQLLWLNLVTNGIQDVALALEPGEPDIMQRPPRPARQPIFDRLMLWNTITSAAAMGLIGFGAFVGMLRAGWDESAARNGLLLLMVLFENAHIGNCRSETQSALRYSPLRSPVLLGGALGALLLHVLAMHLPLMQGLLHVHPIRVSDWAWLLALALTVVLVMEIQKALWRRAESRRPRSLPPPHRAAPARPPGGGACASGFSPAPPAPTREKSREMRDLAR